MYLKIVSHHMSDPHHMDNGKGVSDSRGSWYNTVVPHTDRLFECTSIDVRKYRFDGMKGYRKIADKFLDGYGPLWNIGAEIPDEGEMELLMIWMTDKQDVIHGIVAVDVSAFAMSEDGKTIDKWVCGAGPPK